MNTNKKFHTKCIYFMREKEYFYSFYLIKLSHSYVSPGTINLPIHVCNKKFKKMNTKQTALNSFKNYLYIVSYQKCLLFFFHYFLLNQTEPPPREVRYSWFADTR